MTGVFSDRDKFKVPSLRNAGLRTRYFHNGDPLFNSLFLSIFFYNQGGGFFLDNKDPLMNGVFIALDGLGHHGLHPERPDRPARRPGTAVASTGPRSRASGARVRGRGSCGHR